MRVCQISQSTFDTQYFADLCKGLAARDVSLVCVSLTEQTPPEWCDNASSKSYFCLDAHSWRAYPRAVWQLARLLRREQVDIVQTHLFYSSLVGILAARLARTPVLIATRHHTDQVKLVGTRFHVWLDRWIARQADHVVVLSHAVRNYLISSDQVPGDKIEVIYQGFDFARLSATEEDRQRVRAEFHLAPDDFVLACIGNLYKTKGHSYLLAATKELLKDIPNIRILIVGTGDKPAVEKIVGNLGVKDRVVFAGFRNDVPACIRAADIVVHPSLSEAFCQVLIETMSVGTPLITTEVGGASEVVSHGNTGMLLPPADSAAIVHAVLALYRNPELRAVLAAAGQESVRARFTIERMVSQQVNCYQRWFERTSAGSRTRVATEV